MELVGKEIWVFHWGKLDEQLADGVGTGAEPTTWIYQDFYLLVSASTGDVFYGQLR